MKINKLCLNTLLGSGRRVSRDKDFPSELQQPRRRQEEEREEESRSQCVHALLRWGTIETSHLITLTCMVT